MGQIVTIGQRRWAVGLNWRSFENRPKKADILVDAEELEADWVAIRVGPQSRQAGFTAAIDGISRPKNVYSLGAAIADARPQPWLGIFRIDDGRYWYIAIREGQAILPDGDFIGSQDEVYERRTLHESFDDWTFIEGELPDLIRLIEEQAGSLKLVKLVSLEPIPIILPLSAGLIVLMALAGGIMWWQHHETILRQNHLAAMAAERARLEAAQRAVSPLVSTPAPDAWLAACLSVIEVQPIVTAGWTLAGISCSGTTATLTWHRGAGATVALAPKGTLSSTGDEIVENLGLAHLRPGGDTAQGLIASNLALYSLFQPLGVAPKVSKPAAPPVLPGASPSEQPPPIPAESVSIDLPFDPILIHFGAVPGFRLTGLSVGAQNTWTLTGTIYGR